LKHINTSSANGKPVGNDIFSWLLCISRHSSALAIIQLSICISVVSFFELAVQRQHAENYATNNKDKNGKTAAIQEEMQMDS